MGSSSPWRCCLQGLSSWRIGLLPIRTSSRCQAGLWRWTSFALARTLRGRASPFQLPGELLSSYSSRVTAQRTSFTRDSRAFRRMRICALPSEPRSRRRSRWTSPASSSSRPPWETARQRHRCSVWRLWHASSAMGPRLPAPDDGHVKCHVLSH